MGVNKFTVDRSECGDHSAKYTHIKILYCIPETNRMLHGSYTSTATKINTKKIQHRGQMLSHTNILWYNKFSHYGRNSRGFKN